MSSISIKTYGEDDLTEYTYDTKFKWQFIADVVGDNGDVFAHDDGWVNNNELGSRLEKLGAVTKGVCLDTESCCFYAYFKTKAAGVAFLKKLNAYLSQKANLLRQAKEF